MQKKIMIASVFAGLIISNIAQARDNLSIAGSSTVLPFARIVAEQLGKNPNFKTPVVESGGSSVGKKGVCDGVGTKFIDIGNASSRMKPKELAYCDKNGVKLTEIKVGYDGIVVANSKKGTLLKISKSDLGKALTAEVPVNGKWVRNPHTKWNEINSSLPDIEIRVYGPPTTSGTRASYAEMVNQKGYCAKDPVAKKASAARGDKKGKKCRAMRTDGVFVEAGEQDNLIVQKLNEDTDAYGISNTAPTFENIAGNNYSVSRALYYYVKHQHIGVVPGMKEYMAEWTKHWGNDGVLSDAGMIPMPKTERAKYKAAMSNLPLLTTADLK